MYFKIRISWIKESEDQRRNDNYNQVCESVGVRKADTDREAHCV